MNQTTIKNSFVVVGKTLRTGQKATMICEPYDQGITFQIGNTLIPANCQYIDESEQGLTTTLIKNGVRVIGTEHVLSAFYGLNIDNVLIKLDNEEPPFCVSAMLYVKKIKRADISELSKPKEILIITKKQRFCMDDRYIEISPATTDFTTMATMMDYPNLLGVQLASFSVNPKTYLKEIAWSRTCVAFALNDESWQHKRQEFRMFPPRPEQCKYILYDDDHFFVPMKTENEIARHKILDMIGDFALLQKRIHGRITAYKTGHALNRRTTCGLFNEQQ